MKWIFIFAVTIAAIITIFWTALFPSPMPTKMRVASEQTLQPKLRALDIESTGLTDNSYNQTPQERAPLFSELEKYDWRLDFWTQEQLDAYEKGHRSTMLTDQEKADAFAYRIIDKYLYAVCNPYYYLYEPSTEIRNLVLGREIQRSVWISLLYDSNPATRVRSASTLGYELSYFSKTDQQQILIALKKSYHLRDKKNKVPAIYGVVYQSDAQYQRFKSDSHFEFEWGYGAILAELNPYSSVAKRITNLATENGIDLEQAKQSAYRELEELRLDMNESEFGTGSYPQALLEYSQILSAGDARSAQIYNCNKWKESYQQQIRH